MDIVDGVVAEVYDAKTFVLRVTRAPAANNEHYNVQERVRVAKLDDTVCTWDTADSDALRFLERQRWHPVTCHVLSRTDEGELMCDVHIRSGC